MTYIDSSNLFSFSQDLPTLTPLIISEKDHSLSPSDGKDKELNKRAWRVFKEALHHIYGEERVSEITLKLGYKWDAIDQTGTSLLKKDVIKIMMSLSDVNINDLKKVFYDAKIMYQIHSSALQPNDKTHLLKTFQLERSPLLERLFEEEGFLEIVNKHASFEELSSQELNALLCLLNPFENLHETLGCLSAKISTGPRSLWQKISFSKDHKEHESRASAMLRERLELQNEVAHLPGDTFKHKWEAYKELLTKGISYRELEEGMLIPAPLATGGIGHYKVVKQCASGHGMVAYILKSASSDQMLPSMVLFRGTPFYPTGLSSGASVLSDLEPFIGLSSYNSGKEELLNAIKESGLLDQEGMEVLGYSLGGLHTQFLVHDLTAMKEKNQIALKQINMTLFNSPAPYFLARNFRKMMLRLKGEFIVSGQLFKVKGDPCDFFGGSHLGYGSDREAVPFEIIISKADKINPHTAFLYGVKRPENFSERRITDAQEIDLHLSNKNWRATLAEIFRVVVGLLLIVELALLLLIKRLICRWRGKSPVLDSSEVQKTRKIV